MGQKEKKAIDPERGRWAISAKVGPAFPTQHFLNGVNSSIDTSVDSQVSYRITDQIETGFEFEWESHSVANGGFDLGSLDVFSLMSFVAYHFWNPDLFSFYVELGAGANINTFENSAFINSLTPGASFVPGNTFALRPSGGVDCFVMKSLALNGELGWKWNEGNFTSNVITNGNFDASSFYMLFGAKYYF
jgi:hypothetical protein